MIRVKTDKYLGNIISTDGKNDENVKSRAASALGSISSIMNILNEVSLGSYFFKIGFLLRQTIFLSKLLFSSEIWVNLTKKNIEDLEIVDRLLIKRIFKTPTSTSTKAIHLESGTIPITFLIRAKRIMYSLLAQIWRNLLKKLKNWTQMKPSS